MTAQTTERDCKRNGCAYYRFNVRNGMETIGLQEWDRQDEILACTEEYLGLNDVNRQIDSSVSTLMRADSNAGAGKIQLSNAENSTGKKRQL